MILIFVLRLRKSQPKLGCELEGSYRAELFTGLTRSIGSHVIEGGRLCSEGYRKATDAVVNKLPLLLTLAYQE